jgi:hypothetical protein
MPERPAVLHQRDRLDRAIELASGATAAGMFAYGVALSYQVLHAIAAAAGLPPWAAQLWPLGFEAFMASAALNALAEQRHRRHLPHWQQRVPWYPWTLTGLTAGASILLNWLHPAIPLTRHPGGWSRWCTGCRRWQRCSPGTCSCNAWATAATRTSRPRGRTPSSRLRLSRTRRRTASPAGRARSSAPCSPARRLPGL